MVREQAYPGIDVVYRGDDGVLAYDFVVTPHTKPSAIRFRFEGLGAVLSYAQDPALVLAYSSRVLAGQPYR